jgi:hypothetical protein
MAEQRTRLGMDICQLRGHPNLPDDNHKFVMLTNIGLYSPF